MELKLELGQVVTTKGAMRALNRSEIVSALSRHEKCDWGEMSPQDKLSNEDDLITGGQVMSKYTSINGTSFYIITEGDRSCTTVLLPHEY